MRHVEVYRWIDTSCYDARRLEMQLRGHEKRRDHRTEAAAGCWRAVSCNACVSDVLDVLDVCVVCCFRGAGYSAAKASDPNDSQAHHEERPTT